MAHLMLVINEDERKRALDRLLKAQTLPVYFKKYKYSEHCIKAVQAGEIDLGDMPAIVADRIERELSPAWERV